MASCLTLRKSNCQKCCKCIRRCPVKSIRFSSGQASIIDEECILCGRCVSVCPRRAGEIADGVRQASELLRGGSPVYVSLDPAFVAAFDGAGLDAMEEALTRLGFAGVLETAVGGTIVKNEYERILREEDRDVLISSCCHTVNLLVQKYFPKSLPYLADVISPAEAHCAYIKQQHPEAKCVYVGPCAARKDEAKHRADSPSPDAVLTFAELAGWLKKDGLELRREADGNRNEKSRARLFPVSGGIIKSMEQAPAGYTYIAVDGVERCMAALRDVEDGKLRHCFIEMSACDGGCVGCPGMEKCSSAVAGVLVANFAGKYDFEIDPSAIPAMRKTFEPMDSSAPSVEPSDSEVTDVLRSSGKLKPRRTLNCGSCGYDTCWDFAVAVCKGKAELSMCLPHTRDKAESFSDTIVKNTPNAVVVLNEELEIQQINDAALHIMNIGSAADVLGEGIVRIMNPAIFTDVLKTGSIYHQRDFMSRYKLYVERTVVHDRESHLLICIMRDVTDEEKERKKKESISRETVEVADKVVAKQMRIVQEIASLLGETAAETKVALLKLKEYIADE